MSELYWITRFSALNGLCIGCLVVTAIATLISAIVYLCNKAQEIEDHYDKEMHRAYVNKAAYFFKILLPLTIFFALGVVFVPTTKEALTIWGVGGTIDYLKSNPTAKQLPDKCIKTLDKWVDSWTEKEDSIKVERK